MCVLRLFVNWVMTSWPGSQGRISSVLGAYIIIFSEGLSVAKNKISHKIPLRF